MMSPTSTQPRTRFGHIVDRLRVMISAVISTDPSVRYSARHEIYTAVGRWLGFRAYNQNLRWLEHERVDDSRPRLSDRHFVLHSFARNLASLPGDTAECGVFEGDGSALICLANRQKTNYQHHVFDSFEGLSEPTASDTPADPKAFRWQARDLAVPIERVRERLREFPFVELHRGWIPSKFESVSDRKFALVHIDVDLYEPTLQSIEFFYPRLVAGGVILCDDYGFTTCPGATRALDEFVRDNGLPPVVHLPTGQGFIVRRPGP